MWNAQEKGCVSRVYVCVCEGGGGGGGVTHLRLFNLPPEVGLVPSLIEQPGSVDAGINLKASICGGAARLVSANSFAIRPE